MVHRTSSSQGNSQAGNEVTKMCGYKNLALYVLASMILAALSGYLSYLSITHGLSFLQRAPNLGGFVIYIGAAFGVTGLIQLICPYKLGTSQSTLKEVGEAVAYQTIILVTTPVAAVVLPFLVTKGGCTLVV